MIIGIIWALCAFTATNVIITSLIVISMEKRSAKSSDFSDAHLLNLTKRLGLTYLPYTEKFIPINFERDRVVATKEEVNEIVKRHSCREFNLLLDYFGLEARESLTKIELVKVGKAKK